jgi:hypothetical protein
MKNKRIPLLSLVGILFVTVLLRELTSPDVSSFATPQGSQKKHVHEQEHAQISRIEYTRHARCRMGCRRISEKEIFEVLSSGQKNIKKSNPQANPCPVTTLEGKTSDEQTVRVVYGQCGDVRKIITVIDLKNDFPCDCD